MVAFFFVDALSLITNYNNVGLFDVVDVEGCGRRKAVTVFLSSDAFRSEKAVYSSCFALLVLTQVSLLPMQFL